MLRSISLEPRVKRVVGPPAVAYVFRREISWIPHGPAQIQPLFAEMETLIMGHEMLAAESLPTTQIEQADIVTGMETPVLQRRSYVEHLITSQTNPLGDLCIGESHGLLLSFDLRPVEVAVGIAVALLIVVAHVKDEIAEGLDHCLGNTDLLA